MEPRVQEQNLAYTCYENIDERFQISLKFAPIFFAVKMQYYSIPGIHFWTQHSEF